MQNNNSDFTKSIIWHQELFILNTKSDIFTSSTEGKQAVLFLLAGVINNRKSGPVDVTW